MLEYVSRGISFPQQISDVVWSFIMQFFPIMGGLSYHYLFPSDVKKVITLVCMECLFYAVEDDYFSLALSL